MKHRLWKNSIVGLKTPSGLMESVDDIRGEVNHHFEVVFRESVGRRPMLSGVGFKKLSEEDMLFLEESFNEDKVKQVIWASDCDVIPSPDGFGLNFFNNCWDIIKDDVLKFVNTFHSKAYLSKAVIY